MVVPGRMIATAAQVVSWDAKGGVVLGHYYIEAVEADHRTLKVRPLAVERVADVAVLGALDGQVSAEHAAASDAFEAFCESKRRAYRSLTETGAPKATLVWLQSYLEREREIFGPDPWPYGFDANRKTVQALATYVHEQGLAEAVVPAESLFAPETLGLEDSAPSIVATQVAH